MTRDKYIELRSAIIAGNGVEALELLWIQQQDSESKPVGECPARRELENLRQYVAVEGRPDGDKLLIGLAYQSSIWGPCADPSYEMYELAEAVEKWLREKCIAALAAPCPCEGKLSEAIYSRDLAWADKKRAKAERDQLRAQVEAHQNWLKADSQYAENQRLRAELAEALESLRCLWCASPDYRLEAEAYNMADAVLAKHNLKK